MNKQIKPKTAIQHQRQDLKKRSPRIKINSCQYNYPNCQKTAEFQHIFKLGAVKIAKQWACGNCKKKIQQEEETQ